MKVLESDNDGYNFERAYIADEAGVPLPVAVMGGIECVIQTRGNLLAQGIAFCEPRNPRQIFGFPVSVRLLDDKGAEELKYCITADPKVVAAARRFAALDAEGKATPGIVLE